MKCFLALFTLILIASVANSQDIPKIGNTKAVKENFLLIKKGISNLKKNLTKADPLWVNNRDVIFEMGDGVVSFDDYDDIEIITIKYSSEPYFSGTVDDFKNFYNKLLSIGEEVFGATYYPIEKNTGSGLQTIFVENGKDIISSKTSINFKLELIMGKPYINITVSREK